MNKNLRARANRGFTIIELIVVVTVIGLLAAVAVGAYNKVVYDAKLAKTQALINTLATAKSLFVSDPNNSGNIGTFNNGPDANFGLIAPYIRINGATPTSEAQLLSLSQMPPSQPVTITLGTVDDSSIGGNTPDVAPQVTGYP